jgi:hypothetical protein
VLGDRAERPAGVTGPVPFRLAVGGEAHDVELPEAAQPLGGLVQVDFGEGGPVAGDGDQAAVPAVRLGRRAGQQGLDLGQVIDQVVGMTADGLFGV